MITQKKDHQSDSLYLGKLKFDPALLHSPMAWLLQNARILFLAVFALVLAGVYSYLSLPRELNPEVEIPIVNVVTSLPGANPLDVEELLTKPIEKEVSTIPSIDTLSSSSQNSVSVVTMQFTSTTDPDEALTLAKEKVDLVTDLPDDATTPRVSKVDFNDQPVLQVALVGSIDERSLTEVARDLQDELEREPGIRRVDIIGEEQEEIVVSLKSEALATQGVSSSQIASSIRSSNISLPAGDIVVNQTEYQLTVDNQLTTVADLRSLPIKNGNNAVPLAALADIYLRSKDSAVVYEYATQDSVNKAVEMAVYKTNSATIIDAAASAQSKINELLESYPQVESVTITNTAELISEDFSNLGGNFRDTLLLVFFILFLFLGLKQASIASLSIPLTFLSTFLVMKITGISLNFLSLFSLLLSLGLVVDDAIVIVQSTHRYGQKFAPMEMGLLVFKDFIVPIWTTTITTVWAFLPLLLASGLIGEFIKSIPVVVSAALLSSTTIAVLVNLPFTVILADLKIPDRVSKTLLGLVLFASTAGLFWSVSGTGMWFMLAAFLLWVGILGLLFFVRVEVRKSLFLLREKSGSWGAKNELMQNVRVFWKKRNVLSDGLIDFSPISIKYSRLLMKIVKNSGYRWGIFGLVILFFTTSIIFLGSGLLRTEFFPKTDQDQIFIGVEGPAGWANEQVLDILRDLRNQSFAVPEVGEVFLQTGSSLPGQIGGGATGKHTGFLTLQLPKEEDRDRSSIVIADYLRETMGSSNEAAVSVFELSGGPPAGADLQVNITGSELDVLEHISNQFHDVLSTLPGAINIQSSLRQSPGQIKVRLIESELRSRNLSAIEVASWLRTALSGQESSSIAIENEDIDIIVTYADSTPTLSELKNVRLPTQLGSYTVGEIAYFELETSPITIEHLDEKRVVRVTAAADGISAPELLAAFQAGADQVVLPTGYSWDVGGANQENEESVQSIIQAMGLSVILILITMVLQLNSFRKSLLVLIVIPLAVAGVFFNFTLVGIPLSFPALIGVLALFGIVVNNSIMLVEKINQNIQVGLPFYEAVVDACASRVEPIFFTSLTTIVGLLPITLSDPLWRGLGGAIIAGMTVSGSLILFLLPAMYVQVYAGSENVRASKRGRTTTDRG